MHLGVPAALWLLAALPLIVLLYMLRARRQEVSISSALLWQRARRDLQVQLPVRRLERNLLLLLQLLAVSIVVLALARPYLSLPAGGGPAIVLVLDTSASMQATDVAPSRFEAARAQALSEIARSGGPAMIIEAGPLARAVTGFVDPATARAALARLRPTDAPAQIDQAVATALAQRPSGRGARVIVFTDHAVASTPTVEYRILGATGRNLGIAGLRAEPTVRGTAAIAQVFNAGGAAERVPLTVSLDGRRLLERIIDVPAGGTVSVPVRVDGQGILEARITPRDPLTVDDAGYAVIGTGLVRVVLAGERDRALEEALTAAGAELLPAREIDAQALVSADVVILNRTAPVNLPPGNYLLLDAIASNLPVEAHGFVRAPQVLRWSRSHPVMRYVDLHDLSIARALALRPRGGEVLAEGEVPLIWAYGADGIRALVVGFGLHESDLPLQIAFPIFLSNALAWLSGSGAGYEAGQPLIVPAGPHVDAVLAHPDGSRTALQARGGQFVVPLLDRVGVYSLHVGGRSRRFAVNAAPAESAIAPQQPATARPGEPAAARAGRAAELAPLFLIAALMVLLVEWAVWLRGLPRAGLAGLHVGGVADAARPGARPTVVKR